MGEVFPFLAMLAMWGQMKANDPPKTKFEKGAFSRCRWCGVAIGNPLEKHAISVSSFNGGDAFEYLYCSWKCLRDALG